MGEGLDGSRNGVTTSPDRELDQVEVDELHMQRLTPGRPRGKRRMEQFSSKIEIGLRDDLDRYLIETGTTMVDFLDDAIRARLRNRR